MYAMWIGTIDMLPNVYFLIYFMFILTYIIFLFPEFQNYNKDFYIK